MGDDHRIRHDEATLTAPAYEMFVLLGGSVLPCDDHRDDHHACDYQHHRAEKIGWLETKCDLSSITYRFIICNSYRPPAKIFAIQVLDGAIRIIAMKVL